MRGNKQDWFPSPNLYFIKMQLGSFSVVNCKDLPDVWCRHFYPLQVRMAKLCVTRTAGFQDEYPTFLVAVRTLFFRPVGEWDLSLWNLDVNEFPQGMPFPHIVYIHVGLVNLKLSSVKVSEWLSVCCPSDRQIPCPSCILLQVQHIVGWKKSRIMDGNLGSSVLRPVQ